MFVKSSSRTSPRNFLIHWFQTSLLVLHPWEDISEKLSKSLHKRKNMTDPWDERYIYLHVVEFFMVDFVGTKCR